MPEPIVQPPSLVNLALSFFITHKSSCYTHITLVVPYTPVVFFDIALFLVLIKQGFAS